ncbi:TonB-dependent receptor [Massilia horti]|nr:TonB-dependent receptor [Massilia horti]
MLNEKVLARALRLMFSGGAVLAGVGMAGIALAQQAGQQPMARVEITGSAIKRIDAETSVPITVIKVDDLKKQGVTTVEQVLNMLSVSQAQQSTSQVVGASTGGAAFADLRGIGANKTLVLLNGRRLANNAFDSSAPDLNMIPFAALLKVEVLRDGASSLYGSDAVGGVINFITRKDFQGGVITVGKDQPKDSGGKSFNGNIGFGFGDLDKDRFNLFALYDHQDQQAIGGTERPFNKRYAGGLSPTTSPANYFQGGDSTNPTGPSCSSEPNLVPADKGTSCQMTTSSFVDYIPRTERDTLLFKGTIKLGEDHRFNLEYLNSRSSVRSQIAPVPYGGLYQNRLREDGSLNPYYPGNPGAITPTIKLDPNYTKDNTPAGVKPGFINLKWRDLPNGPRSDDNTNTQQRLVAMFDGRLADWDYEAAATWNENKVRENLKGYSDGRMITAGVLNGIINPFGPQDAAGTALINAAALDGNIQNAKGTVTGIDAHASRELSDWLGAGKPAAIAIGAQASHESFVSSANTEYAAKVVASTGIDPDTHNEGSRHVYAAYTELNVPLLPTLDITAAVRYDKYSDFGSSTNPKVGFRFQPNSRVMLRGSYSTGFRAPSLYEINAAQAYTNSSEHDDPVNCPNGDPKPGKPSSANCGQQFQVLLGGNLNLKPETSRNLTLGLVLEPLNNLSVAIDLWAIELKQAIGSLSDDDVFADPVKYASLYHRNSSGDLSTDGSQCPLPATCGYVDLRTQNLGGTKTNGIDLSASYRLRSAAWGNYTFATNSTYVHRYDYQNSEGDEWHKNVGVYSGNNPVFRWQSSASLVWNQDLLSAGLSAHYKSGYLDQPKLDHPNHRVASYTTLDTYVAWAQRKGLGLTLGVRNLADRVPPLSYQTTVFQAGYDPRYADPTGRTWYVRGTYTF